MSFAARLALCVGIGASLTVSNGAAVGVAVAAGLYLALLRPSRCWNKE
jgi:hypothetical protein